MIYLITNSDKGGCRRGLLFSIIIISLALFGFTSCNFQKKEKNPIPEGTGKENYFPYNINEPDTVYHLPGYLEEISGISCYRKNKIACVQDEKAVIYIFDTEKGGVISKIDFGKDGDYEDIAIVGNNAYILRSDGTLFKVENFEGVKKKVIKIKTLLGKKNNTEGLFFDKSTNSLLIACKGSPSINGEGIYSGFKAIYRFDLGSNKLIEQPAYLASLSKIDSVKVTGSVEKKFIEAAKKLKLTGGGNRFHPSGLAIHPSGQGEIYIISSIGKLLVIMSKEGRVMGIIELDKRIFNQPEGICFSENGDMFISNEGGNEGGNILKFIPATTFLKKN